MLKHFLVAIFWVLMMSIAHASAPLAKAGAPFSGENCVVRASSTDSGVLVAQSSPCGVQRESRVIRCAACPAGFRQVRSQARCTQYYDTQNRPCGTETCEQCLCQRDN